jgi:hypothetical protein
MSIARFKRREGALEQLEIFDAASPGQARKNVVRAVKKILFFEVYEKRLKIVPATLQFNVVALCDVIYTDVQLIASRQLASHFLAQEKIGEGSQSLNRADGIVIGDRHQIHSQALQFLVYFKRVVITFTAHMAQHRDGTHTGMQRVNVQIAPHV